MHTLTQTERDTPPETHISYILNPQPNQNKQYLGINTSFYENATRALLNRFYPKYCCKNQLTRTDGARSTILRCPTCHRQQSIYAGTPLERMRLPVWMFSYVTSESVRNPPQVLTARAIQRRLHITYKSALLLKRRIQLFTSEILPRMQSITYDKLKRDFTGFSLPKTGTPILPI